MDRELFLDENGNYCFGYNCFDPEWSSVPKLDYEDDVNIFVGEAMEPHIVAVKRGGKIGLFTCYSTQMGGTGEWLCRSGKDPFQFDEMWVSCFRHNHDFTGFAACRIGSKWGGIKLIDTFALKIRQRPIVYDNADLKETTVIPFEYDSYDEVVKKLESQPGYHIEYCWQKLYEERLIGVLLKGGKKKSTTPYIISKRK